MGKLKDVHDGGIRVAWRWKDVNTVVKELTKGKRGRSRPLVKFAPPHRERRRVTRFEGEKPALGVGQVAVILRTMLSAFATGDEGVRFPELPASRLLRWTEGQIERLLWAPQDHNEYLQKVRRQSKAKRSVR